MEATEEWIEGMQNKHWNKYRHIYIWESRIHNKMFVKIKIYLFMIHLFNL
jgi:hypothetical protein